DSIGAPVPANFSVSVTDADAVSVDPRSEHTIFSQLLLRSELKGYVEQPNYYFTDVTDEKRDHLDLLMLTQGFRRFRWAELLGDTLVAPAIYYPVEKMVSSVSGMLLFIRYWMPILNSNCISPPIN